MTRSPFLILSDVKQSAAAYLQRNPQVAQKAAGAMMSAAVSSANANQGGGQAGGGGSWI